jgi:hypothetical protein
MARLDRGTNRFMFRLQSLSPLQSLGVEFWLLLPLLGLGFWLISGALTDQMLVRSNKVALYLEGDHQPKPRSRTVQSITAVIHTRQGRSTVTIQTANSALTTLTFEFPTTKPEQIEAALSQELGLPRDRVRALLRYSLDKGVGSRE